MQNQANIKNKYLKIVKFILISAGVATAIFFAARSTIIYNFKSDYQAATQKSEGKLLITWGRGIGEQESIERLKIAAKNIGWDLRVVSVNPKFYIRWFIKDPAKVAIDNFNPDFIFALQDHVSYYPNTPNYMTLSLGDKNFLFKDESGYNLKKPQLSSFDMLLPSFANIEGLKQAYNKLGNKPYQGFHWYPSAHATKYQAINNPNTLFYSGGYLWDKTRKSDKYKNFFKLLDQQGYLKVCGPKKKWLHTPNSVIGLIPIDGTSLLKEQNNAGISLLLHSQQHLSGAAPTGRIFEAAAANTIIISDLHPFVQENFADNILYIDTTKSDIEIYQQIDSHMQWIKQHPEQAKQMAERCHQIFLEKFALETQLTKLIEYHKKIVEFS